MLRMVQRIDWNMILGIIPSRLVTIVVGIYPFLTTHPSSVTTIRYYLFSHCRGENPKN
jgi:hypothetical protein